MYWMLYITGEGVLTKALLKKKGAIKKYVCFEQRKQYLDSLKVIKDYHFN